MRERLPLIVIIFAELVLLAAAIPAAAVPTVWNRGAGPGLARVTELRGMEIRSPQGTLLGALKDLLIAPDGRLDFLVLSRGSAFGDVGPFFLIPWAEAHPDLRRNSIRIAFNEKTVDDAPGIPMKKWPPSAAITKEVLEQVRAYYQRVLRQSQQ